MVLGKLFFIQVIHGEEYSALADRQYSTPSSHIFERGAIFLKKKRRACVRGNSWVGFCHCYKSQAYN